jgi:hypothetical protein
LPRQAIDAWSQLCSIQKRISAFRTRRALARLHRKQVTPNLAQAEVISLEHVADRHRCPIDLLRDLFNRSLHKLLANDFKLGLGPSSRSCWPLIPCWMMKRQQASFGRPLWRCERTTSYQVWIQRALWPEQPWPWLLTPLRGALWQFGDPMQSDCTLWKSALVCLQLRTT